MDRKKKIILCVIPLLLIGITTSYYIYTICNTPFFNPADYYRANAKLVTLSELSSKYVGLSIPAWLPNNFELTAVYDGPDAILTYSKAGIVDFEYSELVIEVANVSNIAPTFNELTDALKDTNGHVVLLGQTPVAMFPQAVNSARSSNLYPSVQYSFFWYNGLYYQVTVRGLSTENLTSVITSMVAK